MQGKNPTTGKMSIDLRVGETLRIGDALILLERKDARRETRTDQVHHNHAIF